MEFKLFRRRRKNPEPREVVSPDEYAARIRAIADSADNEEREYGCANPNEEYF